MNEEKILAQAKATTYRHHSKQWFCKGDQTVFKAMEYFVSAGDFSLQLKNNVKYVGQIEGTAHLRTVAEITSFCIENISTHWKHLKIAYWGREGGTDYGKLKVITFHLLSEQRKNN